MADARILRIEVTQNAKIIVDYEEVSESGYTRKHRCWDDEEAAPSFYDAIKALSVHATILCELPESYAKRIAVKAVKYTYKGDDEIMGAKMLIGMDLFHSEGAVSCWTPHKPSIPYEENAKEPYGDKALSEACVKALWELVRQAQLYIKGERAQIALDFDQVASVEDIPETLEDGAGKALEDDGIEDMGNVVNFPAVAADAATHASV